MIVEYFKIEVKSSDKRIYQITEEVEKLFGVKCNLKLNETFLSIPNICCEYRITLTGEKSLVDMAIRYIDGLL